MTSVTLHAADEWGHLLASGVHGSPGAMLKMLVGEGGRTVRAIERASGAAVATDRATAVTLRGAPGAVARARAALGAVLVPAATIDVAGEWGPLVAEGVYASAEACTRHLLGPRSGRLRAVEATTGARVWASVDGRHIYISGGGELVAAARAAIDVIVRPAACIDVRAQWGGAVGHGAYAGLHDVLRRLLGGHWNDGRSILLTSGGLVWAAMDHTRVFVAAPPETVELVRAELDAAVQAQRPVEEWSGP